MKTRKSIAFTAPQIVWLRKEAKRLGVTFAEALRATLDKAMEK